MLREFCLSISLTAWLFDNWCPAICLSWPNLICAQTKDSEECFLTVQELEMWGLILVASYEIMVVSVLVLGGGEDDGPSGWLAKWLLSGARSESLCVSREPLDRNIFTIPILCILAVPPVLVLCTGVYSYSALPSPPPQSPQSPQHLHPFLKRLVLAPIPVFSRYHSLSEAVEALQIPECRFNLWSFGLFDLVK